MTFKEKIAHWLNDSAHARIINGFVNVVGIGFVVAAVSLYIDVENQKLTRESLEQTKLATELTRQSLEATIKSNEISEESLRLTRLSLKATIESNEISEESLRLTRQSIKENEVSLSLTKESIQLAKDSLEATKEANALGKKNIAVSQESIQESKRMGALQIIASNADGLSFSEALNTLVLLGVDIENVTLNKDWEGDKNAFPQPLKEFGKLNLSGARIVQSSLQGIKTHWIAFIKAYLEEVNFESSYLGTANFNTASINFANFKNSSFSIAKFTRSKISYTKFEGADLRNGSFRGARLLGVNRSTFRSADLHGANFIGAEFVELTIENVCNILFLAEYWEHSYRDERYHCGASIPIQNSEVKKTTECIVKESKERSAPAKKVKICYEEEGKY